MNSVDAALPEYINAYNRPTLSPFHNSSIVCVMSNYSPLLRGSKTDPSPNSMARLLPNFSTSNGRNFEIYAPSIAKFQPLTTSIAAIAEAFNCASQSDGREGDPPSRGTQMGLHRGHGSSSKQFERDVVSRKLAALFCDKISSMQSLRQNPEAGLPPHLTPFILETHIHSTLTMASSQLSIVLST